MNDTNKRIEKPVEDATVKLITNQLIIFPGGFTSIQTREAHPPYWKDKSDIQLRCLYELSDPIFKREFVYPHIVRNFLTRMKSSIEMHNGQFSAFNCGTILSEMNAEYISRFNELKDESVFDNERKIQWHARNMLDILQGRSFTQDLLGACFSTWYSDDTTGNTIRPIMDIKIVDMNDFFFNSLKIYSRLGTYLKYQNDTDLERSLWANDILNAAKKCVLVLSSPNQKLFLD